ncbi:hypothetical protein LTR91_013087 [Friedmanniomyces endolithicus]|uniref:Uncharacterized protein n=1 Tax=Friedmanniomyces endolithicus TaxID=329885 RepID=A0AAN6KE50_9PEZI|nr:hypothetical protein LTR59_016800 [Friedmanniomyces endolithicus]KAK0821573.1 hypothetical protein LTR75_000659 [Friedmanniomyces endolithicus]KAK0876043.1 hypothetical protein LTR87_010095 [Friedmanniomyces endolithicus]KAK0965947.1 hypothetical protein LTS01_018049 [Friedmanniomyces endolithicus]KAK0978056.1 hypothetical protein LTR91_013087 [Friedmanniomyces endolithicus]
MAPLDVFETAGAVILEHSHAILLAVVLYLTLRWLSPAVRSWILSFIVIAVLVGILWHEESLDISDSVIEGFRRKAEATDPVEEGPLIRFFRKKFFLTVPATADAAVRLSQEASAMRRNRSLGNAAPTRSTTTSGYASDGAIEGGSVGRRPAAYGIPRRTKSQPAGAAH